MMTLSTMPVVSHREQYGNTNGDIPPIVADVSWEEEASPFGLQGLTRERITIVKEECVTKLAIALALRGNSRQIRDPEFVSRIFLHHPEYLEEYHVVHLIEKSLWIQGRSDLVMTLTKNPSQIPDNPPPVVNQTLMEAYAVHPQSTIWYGVPVFGPETTPEGLPIPVSAKELQVEANRRLRMAQKHALRWGWFYRMLAMGAAVPSMAWQECVRTKASLSDRRQRFQGWKQRLRSAAQRKRRAECRAQLAYNKSGEYRPVETYRDMPWVDRAVLNAASNSTAAIQNAGQLAAMAAPMAAGGWLAMMIKISIFTPVTLVSCDPFLFIELPEEPGKLRHLAHWYWQEHENGKQTLHLHS